jgi:hypothetical protein
MSKINLNRCLPGQKLRTVHGTIVTYMGRSLPGRWYPHEVKFDNGSYGSRSDDGQVFLKAKLPTDEDIAEILPYQTLNSTCRFDNTMDRGYVFTVGDFGFGFVKLPSFHCPNGVNEENAYAWAIVKGFSINDPDDYDELILAFHPEFGPTKEEVQRFVCSYHFIEAGEKWIKCCSGQK